MDTNTPSETYMTISEDSYSDSDVSEDLSSPTDPRVGEPWGFLKAVGLNNSIDVFALTKDIISIGRCASDIKLPSPGKIHVSRRHLIIEKINDYSFKLSDLGSTNGTLVNGKRIDTTFLKHGDLLIISGGSFLPKGKYIKTKSKKCYKNYTLDEWKNILISEIENALIYKFEMANKEFITENMNTHHFTNPIKEKIQSITGKRDRNTEESTTSKRVKGIKQNFDRFENSCMEDLGCSICVTSCMVEPVILECGHNFCRMCIYEWLKVKRSCPLCRKDLSRPSIANSKLDKVIKSYIKHCAQTDVLEEYIEKKAKNDKKERTYLATARERKKKLESETPVIEYEWDCDEKKSIRSAIAKWTGESRVIICEGIGIKKSYFETCSTNQLLLACNNLGIPVFYTINAEGRSIDEKRTRQTLIDYAESRDGIVTYIENLE